MEKEIALIINLLEKAIKTNCDYEGEANCIDEEGNTCDENDTNCDSSCYECCCFAVREEFINLLNQNKALLKGS